MDAPQEIKFENSPVDSLADSFVSTPGSHYPPLFSSADNSEAMTPPFDDDSMFDQSMCGSVAGTPAPEKKPVKKRKSWGQQLPEPKTNLPPRKRAKTEDEKEQRRVERVLRNRRAAQSSRERKRQEVEALEAQKQEIERRNRDLEMRLADAEAQNLILQQQIAQITGGQPVTVFKAGSSPSTSQSADIVRQPSPLTLSQSLFDSQDELNGSIQMSQTVNPASLSPEIRPVDESSNARSSDMTQQPAALLCDLQCQSEEHRPWMSSSLDSTSSLLILLLSLVSTTLSSTILQPVLIITNSLRTSSAILPVPSVLTTIIWLATTPQCLSTSTTLSTSQQQQLPPRTQRSKRFSLRLSLLRRLLACSPQLARPLMDATVGALRLLASEQQTHARDCLDGGASAGANVGVEGPWLMNGLGYDRRHWPTMECLLTLLWATKLIDSQRRRGLEETTNPGQDAELRIGRARNCELDTLFRATSFGEETIDLPSFDGVSSGKSMEDDLTRWSTAFSQKHGGDNMGM